MDKNLNLSEDLLDSIEDAIYLVTDEMELTIEGYSCSGGSCSGGGASCYSMEKDSSKPKKNEE